METTWVVESIGMQKVKLRPVGDTQEEWGEITVTFAALLKA